MPSTSPTSVLDVLPCVATQLRGRLTKMTLDMIRAYERLYETGRFHIRHTSSMYYCEEDYATHVGCGIQDPQGVVLASILLLRSAYPQEWLQEDEHLRYLESSLCTSILVFVFRNATMLNGHKWLAYSVASEIFPSDVEYCGLRGLTALEGRFLTSNLPLFTIMNETPLALAERELWKRHRQKLVRSREDVCILRGIMPLFALAASLNEARDVYEDMARRASLEEMGRALLNLAATCLGASRGVMFRMGYARKVDKLSREFLQEALAPHCAPLLIGPYKRSPHPESGSSKEVWRSVSAESLQVAAMVFSDAEL